MNTPSPRTSRINFDTMSLTAIRQAIITGSLDSLTPQEREYYSLMDLVRGLRARLRFDGGKIVTRAAIIRLLREQHGLKQGQAYQLYNDAVNFFYQSAGVTTDAFRNLYAERLEQAANIALAAGKLELFDKLITNAARLRGCYEKPEKEIPAELLNPAQTVIYTTAREDLGLPAIDRDELRQLIDTRLAALPSAVRENVRQDAGLAKFNLRQRMLYDQAEFIEPEE